MGKAAHLLFGLAIGNGAFLSAAAVPYTADFAVLNSSQTDFRQYQQIGMTGAQSAGANTIYTWNTGVNGSVVLASKYGAASAAELVLVTAGNASDGVFGDATASVQFKPYIGTGASLADMRFGMSARQVVKTTASNTYPDYRIDYDGANLVLSEQVGYGATRQRTLASQAVFFTSGSSYQIDFSALGTSAASDLMFSVKLYQVGNATALATLSGIDHPKGTVQEGGGTADWADSGQDLALSGRFGLYGSNAGTAYAAGIELTGFSVAVPEPVSAALSLVPVLGVFIGRRRRAVETSRYSG